MVNLTEGACLLEAKGDYPVVQVLSIQKLPSSHFERYSLVVSNGEFSRSALLAIHMTQLIQSQELSVLCVIIMKDFVLTMDQEGTEQVHFLLLFFIY